MGSENHHCDVILVLLTRTYANAFHEIERLGSDHRTVGPVGRRILFHRDCASCLPTQHARLFADESRDAAAAAGPQTHRAEIAA